MKPSVDSSLPSASGTVFVSDNSSTTSQSHQVIINRWISRQSISTVVLKIQAHASHNSSFATNFYRRTKIPVRSFAQIDEINLASRESRLKPLITKISLCLGIAKIKLLRDARHRPFQAGKINRRVLFAAKPTQQASPKLRT